MFFFESESDISGGAFNEKKHGILILKERVIFLLFYNIRKFFWKIEKSS